MEKKTNSYSNKFKINFSYNETAYTAVKKLLKELALIMHRNEKGIIEDIGDEFLHDYRVSIRKSRSILTQLKKIYDKYLTDDLTDKFSFIANSTNQLRDLDVFLMNKKFYLDLLNKKNRDLLEVFFHKLELKRRTAYKEVVKDILSQEHRNFIKKLNVFLKTDNEKQKDINSDLYIKDMVTEQINIRYSKIFKPGSKILTSSPDKKFHRLRIQFKKLRYLIELFSNLYLSESLTVLIEELKEIQDHLGKINDYSIQHSMVVQYLKPLDDSSNKNVMYRNMLLDLTKAIDEEKKNEIILFVKTFKSFIKTKNRILFK
ncbi:MAG TPA: CHAD domain-containing protein [Victivallales bacterium]|nr:CHAD domain-containing protein [Victivallales bacterium]